MFSLRLSSCFQLFPSLETFLSAILEMLLGSLEDMLMYHYSHLRCLEGFPWIVANINKSRYFIDQNRKFFCQLCSECILLSKRDVASVKTEFVTCNKKWLCYDSLDHWSWFDLTASYWCPRTNVVNSAHWENNELEKTELFGQLYCQETWNWKCHIIIGLESAMIKSSHIKKAVLFW